MVAVAATAPVELNSIDPAINTAIAPRPREIAICFLLALQGEMPRQKKVERINPKWSCVLLI
jgi:hypothetical protein